jgi:hypothetical protein
VSAVRNPLFARFYDPLSAKTERAGIAEHRDELLDGLSGRVVELGAGNGMNFRHYPPTVTEVVAVEPEPYLRARADTGEAIARAGFTIESERRFTFWPFVLEAATAPRILGVARRN